MKTLRQNKNNNIKSTTACFVKNSSSGGICKVIKKYIKTKNIIILTDTCIIH